ncbi:MAG TPA: hypothetical protein VGQ65_04220 [Thermoanaerobaculia bacterium]|nr:hypothetical protein [Thermoanaerobaculia bacterium]
MFDNGFLLAKVSDRVESVTSINVVLNWREELKARKRWAFAESADRRALLTTSDGDAEP